MGSTRAGTSPAAEVQSIWFLIWTQAAKASALTVGQYFRKGDELPGWAVGVHF